MDWYPWGEEALAKAQKENKPIFLSIGYSSCHWCHVMQKESFSNPRIAEILNQDFVPIKVDREERPDLDALYMKAVQLFAGHGGWPLNVFLTPELRPFFGGTYFPLEARYGQPAFSKLLQEIKRIYAEKAEDVKKSANSLTNAVVQASRYFQGKTKIDDELYRRAIKNLENIYDSTGGGFGQAPKFFYTDALHLLLLEYSESGQERHRRILEHSLQAMACGGVYDQVGGGFHRYSTDKTWLIPHFEKMLYDNALLIPVYLDAWKIFRNEFYKYKFLEIFTWLKREMSAPDGGFYSSIDADSEHEEGKYYAWSYEELLKLIPQSEQKKFFDCFSVKPEGDFEGSIILHLKKALSEEEEKKFRPLLEKLAEARAQRKSPSIDRKIQLSWNALLLTAFAKAGECFPVFQEEAIRLGDFLWDRAYQSDRFHHVIYTDSISKEAFLEDYAYLSEAYLDLFELTSEVRFYERAVRLSEQILLQYYDEEGGGFWSTPKDQEDLLVRSKEILDSALPSPYAVCLSVMHRLYEWTGDEKYIQVFEKSVTVILGTAEEQCGGFGRLARVLYQSQRGELLIALHPSQGDREKLASLYRPFLRKICFDRKTETFDIVPALKSKWGAEPNFYLCHAGACQTPLRDLNRLLSADLVDKAS